MDSLSLTESEATMLYRSPWFFRSQLIVACGSRVEIRQLRFSPLHRAYEALEVLDTTTGIRFRACSDWQFYELPWRAITLAGRLEQVVVGPLETHFRVAAV